MQTITTYLIRQLIEVHVEDETTPNIRNRIVYAKPVKLYKNVDNTLELRFCNQDQKLVSIAGQTIKLYIIDQAEQAVVITKQATIVESGSTNVGLARVIVIGSDLIDLPAGFYNFSVKLSTVSDETVAYVDDNFGARGTLQLFNGAYPDIDGTATDSVDEYDLGGLGP